jgi:hypothetical protein
MNAFTRHLAALLGVALVMSSLAACSEVRPAQSVAEIPHHDPK